MRHMFLDQSLGLKPPINRVYKHNVLDLSKNPSFLTYFSQFIWQAMVDHVEAGAKSSKSLKELGSVKEAEVFMTNWKLD